MQLLKISACFIALFSLIFAPDTYAKRLPLFTPCSILIQIGNSDREPGQEIPAKYTDRLTVNTDNNHRLYSFADENKGIAELRELALQAEKKEFWAFLPQKKMWIELGFRESYGAVNIDQPFLKTIIRNNDELIVYHIHLKHYLDVMEHSGYLDIPPSWLIFTFFGRCGLNGLFFIPVLYCTPGRRHFLEHSITPGSDRLQPD